MSTTTRRKHPLQRLTVSGVAVLVTAVLVPAISAGANATHHVRSGSSRRRDRHSPVPVSDSTLRHLPKKFHKPAAARVSMLSAASNPSTSLIDADASGNVANAASHVPSISADG